MMVVKPPKEKNHQPVTRIHTHLLDNIPENTNVFHVLARKPVAPEMVLTKRFVFQVDPAGSKHRPEPRRAFVAKCAALLQRQVSVALVDLVTTRRFNLYVDLLELRQALLTGR